MSVRRLLTLLGVLALTGCSARAAEMRQVDSGDDALSESGPTAAGGWQSAPWANSLWIEFPGRTAVEIEHDLGRRPDSVLVYLSFQGDDRDGPERTAFLGAGDVAQISNVNDTSVTIENTTAADFHLRIVLE